MIEVTSLGMGDVRLITPARFSDERGYFSETYHREDLRTHGVDVEFVQDNQSLSLEKGTVRGLHFQIPTHAITKLIRVVRGALFDVVVDLRRSSPSYGRHASVILTASEGTQLLVPSGFAHGFCTLEPDTEVAYKVSGHWAAAWDSGILWNDPDLGIEWPVEAEHAVVSKKDQQLPRLRSLPDAVAFD